LSERAGYDTALIVADGQGNETKHMIAIYDVGKPSGRISRIFKTTRKVLQKAVELDCDLYHLHDPELIPAGLKLKKMGKKVIFDIHENVEKQIRSKQYLSPFVRRFIAAAYRMYETLSLKKFDCLVLAEHSYLKDYGALNDCCRTVLNMPDIDGLKKFRTLRRDRNEIFYVGGISNARGLDVTIDALKLLDKRGVDFKMHYIGPYADNALESMELEVLSDRIIFYGRMPLDEAYALSNHAKVGLAVLKPIDNYLYSYSTKIFEYMAIGMPVITSNFQLYRDVIEEYGCGICIDPLDPVALADAIEYCFSNDGEVLKMGKNGINAVETCFNWNIEEEKLLTLYKGILS
jgi:glycosyltransferase involved in cell wall biosynthesis